MSDQVIRIVAALIRDEAGRVLLVRKRGTAAFMQPGGKRDPGEDDVAALTREIDEELGCGVVPGSVTALGVFDAPAANEPGRRVQAASMRSASAARSCHGRKSRTSLGSIHSRRTDSPRATDARPCAAARGDPHPPP